MSRTERPWIPRQRFPLWSALLLVVLVLLLQARKASATTTTTTSTTSNSDNDPSPIAPPTPKGLPNMHGCVSPSARSFKYCNTSLSTEARLDDLVSHLSLQEMLEQIMPQALYGSDLCATVTRGNARLGVPPWFWLTETNTQVNSACIARGKCATTFVGPLGMAASFNKTSWHLKGRVMGTEMRALNNLHASRFHLPDPNSKEPFSPIALTGFGPNINIARDPRFGRTSELPGEDPTLNGMYAYHMVKGMQTRDTHNIPMMAAFLKHYTAYSTETNRGHDDYNISQYDFWDSYLPQYQQAMKAKPYGVMCSYNAENGSPSCANHWLLNEVLRHKWKHPHALVTTDCGAVTNLQLKPVHAPDIIHAAAFALMNGTDLEMGTNAFQYLQQALQLGLVTRERIMQAVKRTFRVHLELGRFDPPNATKWSQLGLESINTTQHQAINYDAALQSLVLLQNNNKALPLSKGTTIAVVGPQAIAKEGLFSDYAGDQKCFNGTYECMNTIAQAIININQGGVTRVAQGVDLNSNRTSGIAQAVDMAKTADAVVIVVGNDRSIEREGTDRTDTALVGQQEILVHHILALNRPKTVLVLTNGGPLAIDHLIQAPHAKQAYAIVEAFNPSIKGADALAATLFGMENKWGKLPITMYPHNYIQQQSMTNYDMSKFPGRTYKYYLGKPLFGFGHGLSLTTFRFDCEFEGRGDEKSNDTTLQRRRRQVIPSELHCVVYNSGGREGDEVLQLYHRANDIGNVTHPLPQRALRDFVRVSDIPPGGTATATFALSDDHFRLVNHHGKRVLYSGKHDLIVSRSPVLPEQVLTITIPDPPAALTSIPASTSKSIEAAELGR